MDNLKRRVDVIKDLNESHLYRRWIDNHDVLKNEYEDLLLRYNTLWNYTMGIDTGDEIKEFRDTRDGYLDTVYEIIRQYLNKANSIVNFNLTKFHITQLVGVYGFEVLLEHKLLKKVQVESCVYYALLDKSEKGHKPSPEELEDLFKQEGK